MAVAVVIGAQWGDEGKGKIVDHLAERADMVVRYQGGNNAGHTVVIGKRVLKLHQVPSGITRPQVAAVLGHGMVINPPALVEELDMLIGNGIATDNLHISANAHVVMPIYEYRCTACGRRFTEFSRKVLAREEDGHPQCPACLGVETKRLVGSFIVQGARPVHPSEAGFDNEKHEREMQMTPKEHIDEFRKMTNPDPK